MKLFTKTKAVIAALLLLIGGSTAAILTGDPLSAAGNVPIESRLEVGNATQKTGPAKSINARVDDVVNITVWYHNIELPNSNQIGENVNVKINIPGTKTTTHQVTSRVEGSNTNLVTDLATVNTSIPTNISFIPGTATRRYNAGTNESVNIVTEKISDSVVTTGYNLPQLKPCWNFQESINVQARVTASVISITKEVKVVGTEGWSTEITADPGSRLAFLIGIKNEGNERLTNVIVRDNLPAGIDYVEGSARLTNVNYPAGYTLSDALVGGGVNIGNYGVGSNAYVRFEAVIDNDLSQCGNYRFVNVAVVKPDQLGEFYNTAVVNTNNRCVQAENELLVVKFHDRNANRSQDSNEERLSGWKFRVTGPNTNTILTTDGSGSARLANLEPGTYTVTEILTGGWTNTTGLVQTAVVEESGTCTVRFGNRQVTAPPTELPVSGPLETAGMAFGSLSFSGVAMAWARSKKRLKNAFRK